jgi:hypothetical protein
MTPAIEDGRPQEIRILRRAVCAYGESTPEGWIATQRMMNKDVGVKGQSWSLRVSPRQSNSY